MVKVILFIFVAFLINFLGFTDGIWSSINNEERKTYKLWVFKNPFRLLSFVIIVCTAVGFYFL